jgi:hypothetical protein
VRNLDPIREELRSSVELPAFYPKDAPVYPGTNTVNAGERNGRVTAVFGSEDPADRVIDYVKAKLGTLGWGEITVDELVNGSLIHAQKQARSISVLVSTMDEGTEYELTMMVVAVDP